MAVCIEGQIEFHMLKAFKIVGNLPIITYNMPIIIPYIYNTLYIYNIIYIRYYNNI